MRRLLLVDDDAVVTQLYRDRLSAHGFHVNTAGGGAAALSILRCGNPDLVVLDLMMPQVSGVEVLKYIRSDPRLADTAVVLLANDLRNDLGRWAGRLGVQKAFLKAECNPSVLMAAIDEILDPRPAAGPPEPPDQPAAPPDTCPAESAATAPQDDMAQAGTENSRVQSGEGLLAEASAICAALNELFEGLAREARTGSGVEHHLPDLFCRVRFLAEAAGWTQFARLAQTTAVFDAFLHALLQHPMRLGPPQLRTVASLVEAVELLFEHARESRAGTPLSARVLIVDDDPVANEMVVDALGKAGLNACSTEDSVAAWQWINSEQFDLVLLKMEMPVLDGLQLCERLRKVQGYEKTPVILVAAQDDLDNRATSTLSGADDLVAKPILPQEVTARVVTCLVKAQMQGVGACERGE
jgi:DNA-binding response OmpR family regulator